MSYYGEKGKFSFRENFCEETALIKMGELADFGEFLGTLFRRAAIGTDNPSKLSELYVLAGGMSKSGSDVFIINETMPVFRFGIKSAECECGIYLSGEGKLRILFFDRFGINMPEGTIKKIYEQRIDGEIKKNGKISRISHMSELYINSLKDILTQKFNNNAVISCGSQRLSEIWRNFFSSETGGVIFQVSEDGSRVNCYSTDFGFISYERLLLAYAAMIWEKGGKVILPEGFHYAAEELAKDMNVEYEYQSIENHEEVYRQRFTFDALFMCIGLMNCGKPISDMMMRLPKFYTAKRELTTDFSMRDPERTILTADGRVKLSKSGKNRITLTVQSMSMETSAELCGKWERLILERNKKLS